MPRPPVKLPPPQKLTETRVRRIAAHGEQEDLEFKGRNTGTEGLVEAVVCFANGGGGLILHGISKEGLVDGVRLRDPTSLAKTIYHSTSPSQRVETQLVEIGELRVIAIWVRHSAVLVSTSGGAYLQRLGTECVPMTPDRLIVRQIDTRALDITAALTPIVAAQIDERELDRFRRELPDADIGLRQMEPLQMLRAVGAAIDDADRVVLTVAGLLIFGHEADIRSVLPQHTVTFLRTPTGGTTYERRHHSSGPLLRQITEIMSEIGAVTRTRTLRLGARNVDIPDYPEPVLREAIVNAVAHRHFTLPGAVVIRQTVNWIEIENPGGFPEGITAETVIHHAPVHRNRLLCELLDRVRYMERSGLGVDRIFEDQLRYGKVPPLYEADRTMVRLRLDSSQFDEAFARFVLAEEDDGRRWTVEELLVLSYLRRMGPTDRGTLSRACSRGDEEVQEILSVNMPHLFDRFGSGPASRYALSARVQSALGAEAAYTRGRGLALESMQELVLQHARQFGRINNRTVRELLGINMREATYLLQVLESRGDLAQKGSRRWATYVPGSQSSASD